MTLTSYLSVVAITASTLVASTLFAQAVGDDPFSALASSFPIAAAVLSAGWVALRYLMQVLRGMIEKLQQEYRADLDEHKKFFATTLEQQQKYHADLLAMIVAANRESTNTVQRIQEAYNQVTRDSISGLAGVVTDNQTTTRAALNEVLIATRNVESQLANISGLMGVQRPQK